MRRRDRAFVVAVNVRISPRFKVPKPKSSACCAARYAIFRPQYSRRRRHPISTHGMKGASNLGTARPANPAKLPSTSTAQRPQPCWLIRARCRFIDASLSSGVSRRGKYFITSGSQFMAAYPARSESCQFLNSTGSIRSGWPYYSPRHTGDSRLRASTWYRVAAKMPPRGRIRKSARGAWRTVQS